MSCIPHDIFLDEEECERVSCMFCFGAMADPVASPCGHLFGRTCFEEWIKIQARCPLCRVHVESTTFATKKGVKSMIETFKVRCLNTGCPWSGRLKELSGHLRTICPLEVIRCRHRPCEYSNVRAEVEKHAETCDKQPIECEYCQGRFKSEMMGAHSEVCPQKPMDCPLACGRRVKRKEVQGHLEQYCLEQSIRCPLSRFGCPFEAQRKALQAHCESAPSVPLHLIGLAKGTAEMLTRIKPLLEDIQIAIKELSSACEQQANALACLKPNKDNKGLLNELKASNGIATMNSEKMSKLFQRVNSQLSQGASEMAELHTKLWRELGLKVQPGELGRPDVSKEASNHTDITVKPELMPDEPVFDPLSRGHAIALPNPKEAKNIGHGNLVLLTHSITPFTNYRFQITNNYEGSVAIGICTREAVRVNRFYIDHRTQPGCYLFFNDGQLKQPDGIGPETSKMRFGAKDLVELLLDSKTRKLICRNINKKITAELLLDTEVDLQHLFVCAYLNYVGSAVRLVSDLTVSNGQRLGFSPVDRGGAIGLTSPLEAHCLPYSNIAVLDRPLAAQSTLKLELTKLTSSSSGVGVCLRAQTRKCEFAIQNHTGHGCYLFFANGLQQSDERTHWYTPDGQRFTFKVGHVLELAFDPQKSVVVARNLTTQTENRIALPELESLEELYFCVRVQDKDEVVRILSNQKPTE